jgi:hypothetical protein
MQNTIGDWQLANGNGQSKWQLAKGLRLNRIEWEVSEARPEEQLNSLRPVEDISWNDLGKPKRPQRPGD